MAEAVNESSKLVAQSLQLIKDYLEMNDIDNEALLSKAEENLEIALEKLASSI